MKSILISSLNRISPFLSLRSLIRLSGQRLLLPVYHLASDQEVPHIRHIYPVRSVREFEADMDYLLKHFQPLDVGELQQFIGDERSFTGNYFFLSFDDGLREIYDVVMPILKKKGIPALFFLNTGFIDNRQLFYRYKASLLIDALKGRPSIPLRDIRIRALLEERDLTGQDIASLLLRVDYHRQEVLDKIAAEVEVDFESFLKEGRPYLTTAQINTLLQDGFTIGAHSSDHPEYRFIPLEAQLSQTRDSLAALRRQFGVNAAYFAFPFTDYGVSKAFFDTLSPEFTLSFGSAGLKHDSYLNHFQRFPMEGTHLPASTLIKTEYLYYLLKMPLGKNRIRRE